MVRKNREPLSPENERKVTERIEWLIGFMIVSYRFVYHVLSMMTKTSSYSETNTIGVRVTPSNHIQLVYNPAFIFDLTDSELTYVFYHEIIHLVLHHCTTREFDDEIMSNYAHDLAANEIIPVIKGSCEPPKNEDGSLSGVFVNEFRKMKGYEDIQKNQTAEWYYEYLKSKSGDQPGNQFDDHGGWKNNEVADERVRAKIQEIVNQDLWGSVSALNKERILAAQVRKVNWRNLLRRFYGNRAWHERESTRKRPNRRTGLIHPGRKKVFVDRHLVAIDTSGSTYTLLDQFLGVINQMVDFIPIDIMQFDCTKLETPKPYNRKRKTFDFIGQGGTDFTPVIETADEHRYKSVVIVTDGEAAAPPRPKTSKVVWVLPTGKNPPVDWGQRIHMSRYV